jgi:hypothetical protein
MTTSNVKTEISVPGGWRFKLGIFIFGATFALWLVVPLAASLGVPGPKIAAVTGVIFVANKVLLVVCIAVMGKPGFQQLKALIFGHAKRLAPSKTVGPVRHVIGLVMFCLPLVSAMLEPYVEIFRPGLRPNVWQFQVLGDLMLMASFFVLGGDFWSKIHALFVRTV